MKTHFVAALLALATATVPLAAVAQGANGETIRGTIVSLDGAGNLQLRDDRGFVDSVRLDPNVDVTPPGVQLQPGMHISIAGSNAGSVFAAESIAVAGQAAPPYASVPPDAYGPPAYPYGMPYAYPYPAPYPVYAYPYPVYPYPVYGYPGPRVSIGIGFGPRFGFRGGHHR
jgi:hypothetical protein